MLDSASPWCGKLFLNSIWRVLFVFSLYKPRKSLIYWVESRKSLRFFLWWDWMVMNCGWRNESSHNWNKNKNDVAVEGRGVCFWEIEYSRDKWVWKKNHENNSIDVSYRQITLWKSRHLPICFTGLAIKQSNLSIMFFWLYSHS